MATWVSGGVLSHLGLWGGDQAAGLVLVLPLLLFWITYCQIEGRQLGCTAFQFFARRGPCAGATHGRGLREDLLSYLTLFNPRWWHQAVIKTTGWPVLPLTAAFAGSFFYGLVGPRM